MWTGSGWAETQSASIWEMWCSLCKVRVLGSALSAPDELQACGFSAQCPKLGSYPCPRPFWRGAGREEG
jgi:hypothetical protein